MDCTNCGGMVNDNNHYCGTCGAKVLAQTGAALRTCLRCGTPLRPGMKFCINCGHVAGETPPSPYAAAPLASQPAFISPPAAAPAAPSVSAAGTATARPEAAVAAANQAAPQARQGNSPAQKISLSAALFGVICFFLPWVEVSCMGMHKTASGLQLAADVDLPEVWLVLAAMLAAGAIAGLHLLGRKGGDSLSRPLSLAMIAAGILPLVVCFFEWLRFANDISRIKGGDPYGFGRMMGSAIENSVNYEFGGVLTVLCSLGVIVGGFLHLAASQKRGGSP